MVRIRYSKDASGDLVSVRNYPVQGQAAFVKISGTTVQVVSASNSNNIISEWSKSGASKHTLKKQAKRLLQSLGTIFNTEVRQVQQDQ